MYEHFVIHDFIAAEEWSDNYDESDEFLNMVNELLPQGQQYVYCFDLLGSSGYYLVEWQEDVSE